MNLPTKEQCIDFAMGLTVQYDDPVTVTAENKDNWPALEVGAELPGEIILTDEMLSKLIEFCQTKQPQQ